MNRAVQSRSAAVTQELRKDGASQIVEFAVSLPLLVVFVVGIFDFSGAFTLKQKLTNAAREGARAAAADPATDLGNAGVPASVSDAAQVVDNYLLAQQLNDCGLGGAAGNSSGALTWTYTPSVSGTGCPGNGLKLTVNRGFVTQQTVNGSTVNVVDTQVTLEYAYQWRFNTVITLLVPGATYKGVSTFATSAVALNEN
jgi:Flp pilus assembly protein TadG